MRSRILIPIVAFVMIIAMAIYFLINPSYEKSFCDKKSLERYGLMPSQKGEVTKDEAKAIAEYMFSHFTQENLSQIQKAQAKFDKLPAGKKVALKYKCVGCHKDAIKTVDLGFYIGVDGPITFKNPKDILPIVEAIDLNHILVETDSPYLAPMPHRGKRNEPSYLIEVVKKIAEIKDMSVEQVSKVTTENAIKLFHIGGSNHEA